MDKNQEINFCYWQCCNGNWNQLSGFQANIAARISVTRILYV